MIYENLYEEVLIKPTTVGANKLFIVSGYATAAMAFHHVSEAKKINDNIQVNLVVGMCPTDGLSLSNFIAFKELVNNQFPSNFQCSYLTVRPPVHTKLYIWFKEDEPLLAYLGSANYTQNGFSGKTMREALTLCETEKAYNYYTKILGDTIYCNHNDVEDLICIYKDNFHSSKRKKLRPSEGVESATYDFEDDIPKCVASLLDRSGHLPERSGLNWGQRPEQHREPNQAYIRLPLEIARTDFFPPVKVHFTVRTDDNKVIICTRAQSQGKAIHTPHNNSLLGEYFRSRLGIPNGEKVTLEHLVSYGRTDISFYKLDEETYFMDFSVT